MDAVITLWRVVSFVDRLIFCQHEDAILERDPDGSLWRQCQSCRHRAFVALKGNVVRIKPTREAHSYDSTIAP